MKFLNGKVISKKMQKTATVLVERSEIHPIYLKRMKKSRKYQVHDEMGANVGDIVKFTPTRPISKTKKWKIVEIKALTKSKLKKTERKSK